MAKNIKPYKKSKATRRPTDLNSQWFKNATKSINHSAFDVFSSIMPATSETIVSMKELIPDIRSSYRDTQKKLGVKGTNLVNMGKDMWKNSLEDLKSGNFYNEERLEANNPLNMDFGDLDLDTSFDDSFDSSFDMNISSDDGNAFMEMSQTSDNGNEYTQIHVDMNLGEDSILVQATQQQTEVSIKNSKLASDISTKNVQAIMARLSNIGQIITSSLSAINDNVSSISTVVSESITANMSVANKYYEDSLAIFTEMNEKMTTISDSINSIGSVYNNTSQTDREVRDYNSVLSMFDGNGGLDLMQYKDRIKKQGKSWFESSLFGSMFNMVKMTRGLNFGPDELRYSPLSKAITAGMGAIIPNAIKTSLSGLDEQIKETVITSLVNLGGLRNSSNPLLSILGNVFGIRNSKYNVNKGNYNKGPMAWNGIAHRTLVDVIPAYLSQIAAAVTGTEQKVFDYEKGVYKSLKDVRKEYDEDEEWELMMPYNSIRTEYDSFLRNFSFSSDEQEEEFRTGFDKYIKAIIKNPGTMDFNNLQQTTSAVDGNEQIAKMIQQFMQFAPKTMVTAAYGRNALAATEGLSRRHKDIESDPTYYNGQYINNGLTEVSSNNGSGLLGRNVDPKGRDTFWYLERILRTINTVVPVRIIHSGEDFNLRMLSELGGTNPIINNPPNDDPPEDTRQSDNNPPQDDHSNNDQAGGDGGGTRVSLDSLNDSPEELRERINNASGGNNDAPERRSKILKTMRDAGFKEDSNIYKLMSNIVSTGSRVSGGAASSITKISESLFSALFSKDPNERGFNGLINTTIEGLKKQFEKFSSFMDEKVIGPINESLFGEEGFITKLSESEAVKNFKDQISNVKNKATNFLFGEPDADGVRHNGIFSSTLNSLREMGTSARDFIFKDEDGVVSSMKRIFHDTTDSIRSAIGINNDEETAHVSFADRVANGASDFLTHIQQRGSEWVDLIFGPSDENARTELRDSLDTFMGDMKGKKGKLAASSVVGLLGSFFLPGGPIAGALLGLGTGIVSESSQLKDFLFGEMGEDGERLNTGLISRGIQDFFKDNKTGISIGAIGGLISSVGLLPSFFFPGGPIGGALLGGAVSYLHKSGAFNDFIYGKDGTKENITGGITKFIKDHYKQDADVKSTFLDAGMGAGVGLLGSFFLPGGPITGALLGSAANIAINTDKFKTLMFGEEELDEEGNKTGKRSGGLFGKFTKFMGDKVIAPLTIAAKKTQIKLTTFIEKNMLNPLKASLEPFRVAGKEFIDGVKSVVSDIKDAFVEKITRPISDAVHVNIIDPMKNVFKNIFSGIGKVIGSIVSAPFKAIQGTAESLNESQVRRGVSDYNMQETLDRLNRRTDIKQTFAEADIPSLEEARSSWWNPFRRRNNETDTNDDTEQTEMSSDDESQKGKNDRKRGSRKKAKDKAKRNSKRKSDDATNSEETEQSQADSGNDETTRISDEAINNDAIRSTSENTRESTDHLRNIRETIQNILNRVSSRNDSHESEDTTRISDNEQTVVSDRRQNSSIRSQGQTPSNNGNTSELNTQQSDSQDEQTRISTENNNRPQRRSNTTDISNNVKKIADSVDGQLNGVGYNVNKILKVLLKKNGMSDEEVEGENNKKYSVGHKLKNLLMSPVRAMQSLVKGVTTAVKDTVSGIFKGVAQIGKGLLKIPGMIVKTAGNAVKAIAPAIGTVVKGAASLIGSGLKAAGSVIQGAAEGFGKMLSGASEGFGKLIGGALGGLGSLLHGVGLIGKEIAPAIGKAIGAVIGAPFKLAGAAGGLLKKIFGKNKNGDGSGDSSHIIVDDILHQTGEEKLFDYLESIHSAILSMSSSSTDNATVPHIDDELVNSDSLRLPLNLQMFGRSREDADSSQDSDEREERTTLRIPINLQRFANVRTTSSTGTTSSSQNSDEQERAELNTRVSEGSAESLQEKFSQEDSEEKENSFKNKLLSLIQKNNDDQEEHASIWSSIFSKKGLITGALLLAAPLIIKLLPTIGQAIGTISNVVQKLFDKFFPNLEDQGGVQGAVNGLGEQVLSVTDAVGLTDRSEYAIGENGELLTDENGNVVKTQYKDDIVATKISEFYTPTVTKVDHETGQLYQEYQYDGVSAAKLNATRGLAHTAYKKGTKTVDAVKNVASKAKKLGKGVIGAAETAAIHIDDLTHTQVATTAYDAVGSAVKGTKTKVSNAASGTVSKIIDLIKGAFKTLSEKIVNFVQSKAPGAASKCGKLTAFIDDIVKKVAKSSVVTKYLGKFTVFFSKAATAAGTLLASEWAWGAVGFVSGATNAGYTFEVKDEDVDALMIAISGLFRGLLNTSVGSIVDIVASIFYEITGTNIVANLAVMTYNFLMGLFGQSDKIEKLNSAREEFTADYNAYQEEEYNAYVKNQEANGQTAMSFDDFKASDLSTSKSEYNAQQNQSIFKRGMDAINNGASRVSRFVGNKVTSVKNGLVNVGTTIKDAVSNKVNSVKTKVSGTVSNVKTKIKETYDNSKLKTIVDSTRNVASFLIQGVTSQLKYAWTGDKDDLIDMPADDDDPLIATKKIVLIGTKVMLAPITNTIKGVRHLFDFAKKAWNTVKSIGNTIKTSITGRISAAWAGQDYEVPVADENNPLSKISTIVNMGAGVIISPITSTIRTVRQIFDFVKMAWVGVKSIGSTIKTSITGRISAAWNGEDYETPMADETNPLSKISTIVDMGAGVILSPIIPTISMVRVVYESIKNLWSGVKAIGSTIKDSVTGRISAAWNGEHYTPIESDDESNPLGMVGRIIDMVTGVVMFPVTSTVSSISTTVSTVKNLFGKFKDLSMSYVAYQDVFNDKTTISNYWDNPDSEEDGILGMIKAVMFYITRVSLAVPFYINRALIAVKNKIKEFPGKILSFVETLFGSDGVYNEVTTDSGGSGGKGGSAPSNTSSSTINGFTYYSQNDTRIKDESYNESNGTPGTMGERGCGPTALSMVATELTGQDYDPTSMARIAEQDGYSTEVGTTTGYFGSVGSRLGMGVSEGGANPNAIRSSLENGNPVILQGASGGANSPYTSQGHYVVGVGLDGDNVLVNDPRGPQYSKGYSMDDIMNGAAGMWSFSGGKGPVAAENITVASLPSLSDLNKSMSPIAKPSFLSNGSADTTDVSKNSNEAAEQALVNSMYSIKDSLAYSMTGPRDPDQGSADCSSTVQWAYKKALGIDPGGNTRAQIADGAGYFVDTYSGGAPNESNLRPGDLLFYGSGHTAGDVGHVEMYVGDNKLMGHGGGTNGSVKGPTEKTMSSYRLGGYIGAKRYMGEGTDVVNDFSSTTVSSSTPSTPSTDTSSDSTSSGFSLSNFISGAIQAVQTGIDNFFGTNSGNTTTSSTPSTTGTGATVSANVNPDECAQAIWVDLTQKGLTPQGVAGLLGNLHKESGVQSNNLQNTGNKKLGMSDAEYTTAVDNGSYGNFVNDKIGYGLAQWTSAGRKQGLLNLAKSRGVSIGDPTMQADWLYQELSTDYKGVLNTLKSTNSVYDAAKVVCTDFERPAAKDSPAEQQERANFGQGYYDKLAGNTYTAGGYGDGPKKHTKPTTYKSSPMKQLGGKGPNAKASSPVQGYTMKSTQIPNVTSGNQSNKDSTNYISKLFDYLGKIVMYMESTSSGISQLNQKDFGSGGNNYTNQSSYTNVNGLGGSERNSSPDTSNYELGKLIAQGQLF